MSKEKIIYWAPHSMDTRGDLIDWNILYKDIYSLNFYYNKNIEDKKNNFMQCPAVTSLMKNTFVIENPIESSFVIENNSIIPISKNYISAKIVHEPTIKENILFKYDLSYYFFSEEEIEMTLTSPYFNETPHAQYGSIVPGKLNIGAWFRPINFEFNLWNNINTITIKENEPIAYVNFNSNEKITLQRFYMNKKLYQIAETVASSTMWEPKVSLSKRYERFRSSRTNKIVLNEIRKNLV